jgi:hypothetical protein
MYTSFYFCRSTCIEHARETAASRELLERFDIGPDPRRVRTAHAQVFAPPS